MCRIEGDFPAPPPGNHARQGEASVPSMLSPRFASRPSSVSPHCRPSLNSFFVEKHMATPWTFCFAPLAAVMLKIVE